MTIAPKDFMARVVAWPGPSDPGYVNFHWFGPLRPGEKHRLLKGTPVRDLDKFVNIINYAHANDGVYRDCYFTTAVQRDFKTVKTKTGKEMVVAGRTSPILLKTLWFDVDVKAEGNHYRSKDEALDAIEKFCKDTGWPMPTAGVDSGGGIQVYWINKTALPLNEWRAYAHALWVHAQSYGLLADPITEDPNRVLRLPGTWNNKYVPPQLAHVRWLLDNDLDFAADLGTFLAKAPALAPAPTGNEAADLIVDPSAFQRPAWGQHLRPTSIPAGMVPSYDPLDPTQLFKQCGHYRHELLTEGQGTEQGLWMQTVLGLTFVKNGRAIAHGVSKGYATYTPEETDAMFDRKAGEGLGWPSCQTFSRFGSKPCEKCPLRGKIKSPLNLCLPKPTSPPPGSPGGPGPSPGPAPAVDLGLPPNCYIDTQTGLLTMHVAEIPAKGDELPKESTLEIFTAAVTDVFLVGAPDGGLAFEIGMEQGVSRVIHVPARVFHTRAKLLDHLAANEAFVNPAAHGVMVKFMTDWITSLRRMGRQPTNPRAFGWHIDHKAAPDHPFHHDGFAYGGTIFRTNGEILKAYNLDAELRLHYKPEGDPKYWRELHEIVTSQNTPSQEVVQAIAFASPLMCYAGTSNCSVIIKSPKGGHAYKTTNIKIACAVWANHRYARAASLSTVKGAINKLQKLGNIPYCFDEVNEAEMVERVRQGMNVVAEGVPPDAMLKDGITKRDKHGWDVLVGVGTNISFRDESAAVFNFSDAQLLRMFEIDMPVLQDTVDGLKMDHLLFALESNYGHVGVEYAQLLARRAPLIQADIDAMDALFRAKVGGAGRDERYWVAACVSMLQGATYANMIGCKFHIDQMMEFLAHHFLEQRTFTKEANVVAETKEYVQANIDLYLNDTAPITMWTENRKMHGKDPEVLYLEVPRRISQNNEVPYNHFVTRERLLLIQIPRLKEWGVEHGINGNSLVRGAIQHLKATKERLTIGGGTQHLAGKGARASTLVIRIADDPDAPFVEMLWRYTKDKDKPAMLRDLIPPGQPETDDAPSGTPSGSVVPLPLRTPGPSVAHQQAVHASIEAHKAAVAAARGLAGQTPQGTDPRGNE